jgi:superfamily II DNA/RNA helicase
LTGLRKKKVRRFLYISTFSTLQFHQLALQESLLEALEAMNFQQATPIQQQAIPLIIQGHDLLACAQTGTGKTGAYLIPVLNRIAEQPGSHTSVLVLVPTRELALQIDQQIQGLGYFVGATSIAVYGGNKGPEWDQQKKALTQGADIIVTTPGRLIAHLQLGYVRFDQLQVLILDEADRMLDMGFLGDIQKIMSYLPAKRQTLMFSATMPPKIGELAKQILHEHQEIRLAVSKPAEGIDQQFYLTYDHQKMAVLTHLIRQAENPSMVLFTSQKSAVDTIVRGFRRLGLDAFGISSNSDQEERERVLMDFKNKKFSILVATDVLSRGIDIDNLSHVVNYDVPRDPEDYVHRIGRTARAEAKGTAITLVNEADQWRVRKIERLLEREFEKRTITEELGLGEAPAYNPSAQRDTRGAKAPSSSGRRPASGRKAASPERSERSRKPKPTTEPVTESVAPVGNTKKKYKKRRKKSPNTEAKPLIQPSE